MIDLFASTKTFNVPWYFSAEFPDKKYLGGDVLKVEWLEGLKYAFPSPKHNASSPSNADKIRKGLMMVTPFWPDHSWFPEVMRLASEPQGGSSPYIGFSGMWPQGKQMPKS